MTKRSLIACCLALSGCPGSAAVAPALTGGLTVDGSSVSLYSVARSKAHQFAIADGAVLSQGTTKPPLRGAWARNGVAYGWDPTGASSTGLFSIDVAAERRRWIADKVTRSTIHWIDDTYVFVGRSLLDKDSGAVLIAYRKVLRSGSPDLVLACDDENRAFAVKPATASVYWQQGRCGDAVALHGKRWTRVSKSHLELCELSTGAVVWHMTVVDPPFSGAREGTGFDLVAMDEARVYVATDRGVSARSTESGEVVWSAPQRGEIIAGEGVVAVSSELSLDILDATTGKLRFRKTFEGDRRGGLRTAFAKDRLLVRTNAKLTAIDVASGAEIWSRSIDG